MAPPAATGTPKSVPYALLYTASQLTVSLTSQKLE